MSEDVFSIEPLTVVESDFITSLSIAPVRVVLDRRAAIVAHAYNDAGRLVSSFKFELEGKDYDGWSADDGFVMRWVLERAGLTASTAPADPSAPALPPNTTFVERSRTVCATREIVQLGVSVVLDLAVSGRASIAVKGYDRLGSAVKSWELVLDGADYGGWSDQDDYVRQWVCGQLDARRA